MATFSISPLKKGYSLLYDWRGQLVSLFINIFKKFRRKK